MNDFLLSKTPPHSIDAEESVLSSLFINNSGFEDTETLTAVDFYKGVHKKIYAAMLFLRKKKDPVDLVTVAEELIKREELESIGGASYLARITDTAPIAINIAHHARVVQEFAKAREMIVTASNICEKGFNVKDIEQYISDSQAEILSIQTSTSKDKFFTMETLMQDAQDRIEAAQNAEFELGLNFGMPKLDKYMQVWGSKLILLAGRPGMGKTSLALSIAVSLGYQEKETGFLSIEMDKEQFADKMLSAESNVNSMIFYARQSINRDGMRAIDNAAQSLATLPIHIDDSECGLEDVKRKCRKLKKIGCEIIFIDQLSQISYERGLKAYHGISKNCTEIKQLTKELRIPIVLLCQLNRNVESRDNKRPNLGDLAETGRLEQDADMILFLYRDGYYDENVDESCTEIILAKNRQGDKGTENGVLFKKNRGMFQLI